MNSLFKGRVTCADTCADYEILDSVCAVLSILIYAHTSELRTRY